MLSLKEYEKTKKKFISDADLNSDNIYNYFNDAQIKVIQNYYEYYTKCLFMKLVGSLRLNVSPSKIKKLIELKGDGNWEFAGMIDARVRGAATCELGHSLRYVYFAKNVDNGHILQFGSRCVSDFFDMDEKGVKALLKIKDEMFSELKELAAIKENNLFEEHYSYDCNELGNLIRVLESIHNTDGLLKVGNNMNSVLAFYKNGLPLPKSLILEILNSYVFLGITNALNDLGFFGVDSTDLDDLKGSSITLISKMFINSEKNILDSIKENKLDKKSDFFNFRNINDLQIAINTWLNREKRLLKIFDFFEGQRISNWLDIYKYSVKTGYNRENVKFYNSLLILMLFNKDIKISENFYWPKEYDYKGYSLNDVIEESFDDLLNYMTTRDFILELKGVLNLIDERNKIDEKEAKRVEDMMSYLRENLPLNKFENVAGIAGVSDIILKKKLEYDNMSDRQQSFVESVYKSMKNLEKKNANSEQDNVKSDADINNRYPLKERPDMLAKIQRLQDEDSFKEALEKEKRTADIMDTVMKTHFISDKQIKYINTAYSVYILHEKPKNSVDNADLFYKTGNRKWNLIERPDVKEKIEKIQGSSKYSGLYENTKSMLENILKYSMVSNKQIETVDKVYKRIFS